MSQQQQPALPGFSQEIRSQLMLLLARSGLPKKLIDRLINDVDGRPHYERVASINDIPARAPNSSYWGTACCCTCSTCTSGILIPQGKLGKLDDNGTPVFLAPGYHTYSNLGCNYLGEVSTAVYNEPVIHGAAGFVTITEGRVGVLLFGATYCLLAPGTYCWSSPAIRFTAAVDVTGSLAKLGPFTLVSVPSGMVAITYWNGELKVLGEDDDENGPDSVDTTIVAKNNNKPSAAAFGGSSKSRNAVAASSTDVLQRTFFLDDPKWIFHSFLTKKTQMDKLEGNDLLSKDNVEILMTAFANWRISNAYLAITECADDMEAIRVKVDSLVRATIARIVAGTNIGHNVSGVSASQVHTVNGQVVHDGKSNDEDDLSHMMQSDQALIHMKELSNNLSKIGIIVQNIYVPEKRMKNENIRDKVASQSVIGIQAEAERTAAEARAYSVCVHARAEAEAINEVARAHAEAGRLLGDPTSTAARLALSEISAKALTNANVTIFSGAPDQMPFMFTQPIGKK